jgi:hypothetical protein
MFYIHIYICLFILTFMALLLSERSTEDRMGRKVAGVARREMYKNTKADDHNFEVRHPRCVLNKSNCKVYAYIVKQNYIWGGMLFTICKAQLHVSATNFGHLQVVQ